ncbi:MAG: hypothetical protein ABIX01_09450 [Chitinophagaceae bacterium]
MGEKWFDNIEDISREASEQYDVPFKEASWKKMEALLDKEEKKRFPIWWWLVPALLLVTGGGIWLTSRKTSFPTDKQALVTKEIPPPAQPQTTANSIPNTATIARTPPGSEKDQHAIAAPGMKGSESNTKDFPSNKAAKELAGNNNGFTANTSEVSKSKTEDTALENKVSAKGSRDVKQTVANKRQAMVVNPGIASGFKPAGGKNGVAVVAVKTGQKTGSKSSWTATGNQEADIIIAPPPAAGNDLLTKVAKSGEPMADSAKQLDATPTKITDSAPAMVKTETATISSPAKQDKKAPAKNAGFTFSITGSADFSTVKFKKANKVSTGYGLGVAYRFGNRWALGTGVGFTQKRYLADSTNYKKISFMGWYPQVLKIDASCGVVEVPVNIQYLISRGKKSNWYATAGLSSYFMKKESYDYTIKNYGVEKLVNYSYSNASKHYFSILNLQLDYEKKLGETTALRLSPFMKLPLAGIGVGKVSLESVGVQASIQWAPSKKK